jgi:hypothetical protein
VTSDLLFSSFTTSLRSPRVALCLDEVKFVPAAMRALQVHSQLWGGAGNTVVVSESGTLHPAVIRALQAYDPDHVTTLAYGMSDVEAMFPGSQQLIDRGKVVTDPQERADLIAMGEADTPCITAWSLQPETVATIAAQFNCFGDDRGGRVPWLHPAALGGSPLSTTGKTLKFDSWSTGDELIDLAVALRRGAPVDIDKTLTIGSGISKTDVARLLVSEVDTLNGSPFSDTVEHLEIISGGPRHTNPPLVVLGRAPVDMSLAATIDRQRGSTSWLPFDQTLAHWYRDVSNELLRAARYGTREGLLVTSVSLNETECMNLFEKIKAAGFVTWPTGLTSEITYIAPDAVVLNESSMSWRISEHWETRFTAPMNDEGDGAHLASPPPLEVPAWFKIRGQRSWVIDITCMGRPVHTHPSVCTEQLVAPGIDPRDTLTRVSNGSLSFESGRWGLVLAGASPFGQLSNPRLRWPGIRESLDTAAQAAGSRVRPSAAGKIAGLTVDLWGGRDKLIADLLPSNRPLLDRFTAPRGDDGALDEGPKVGPGATRIRSHNRCLVPFTALTGYGDPTDVRSWIDERVVSGAIRTGLMLQCGACPWSDFYPLKDVSGTFQCARCGTTNHITHERWRMPVEGPYWYNELHPTAAGFLEQNGDGPLLAVHHHKASRQTDVIDFELEFIDPKTNKAWAEVDFAIVGWDGLVLGEAKTNGKLDGRTVEDRVSDVNKLFRAASVVGADEVCFATFGTWRTTSVHSIKSAMTKHKPIANVTLLEDIETTKAKGTKL